VFVWEKERWREGETDKRKRGEWERNATMQKERSKIDSTAAGWWRVGDYEYLYIADSP
jgi:hypothetical protein